MTTGGTQLGWAEHALLLARFVLGALFVRPEVFGEFGPGKQGRTVKAPVTEEILAGHFRGERFLGAHTTSTNNLCLFGALDFDEDTNPRNFEVVQQIAQRLRSMGFAVLLEESRTNRYHVWIRFEEPVPTALLYALLQDMAREAVELGLREPETFPKQAMLASANGDGPFGNWLRLPGKHPETSFCSRIFDAETDEWLEGADAAQAVLAWPASASHILPEASELSAPGPTPSANGPATSGGAPPSELIIPDLQRNTTLTSIGGAMRRRGLGVEAIEAALQITNRDCCVPPLEHAEITKIARSLGRYPPTPDAGKLWTPAVIEESSAAGSGNRFKEASITDTDFFALDIAKPTSILGDGLFPATEYGVLYGRPGLGKSWLMDQLAYAMARGVPWHGIETTKGRVGIISLEMAEYYRRERLRHINGGKPTGDIAIITIDRLGGSLVDLIDAGQQRELIDWASGEGLKLVMIDPLALSFSGSEIDEAAVGPLLAFMREFPIRAGCGLLPVHHEPKPSQGLAITDDLAALRGLAKIGDLACLLLRFKKQKDGSKQLRFAKVRYAAEPDPLWFGADKLGAPVLIDAPASPSEQMAQRREKVAEVVRENPALNAAEIHRRLQSTGETVAVKTIERDLEALEKTNLVRAIKAARGKERLWRPVSDDEVKRHAL